MPDTPRHRPGDQPPPVPNDRPSIHDLVIGELEHRDPEFAPETAELLRQRKALGLDRYKSLLQAFNGHDADQDLAEELADAVVYARQRVEEHAGDELGPAQIRREVVYQSLLHLLNDVCSAVPETGHLGYGGPVTGAPAPGDGTSDEVASE